MSAALTGLQNDYAPDPRNEPDYWTARKLAEERRPPTHKDGWGGQRRLWIACGCGCGAQRTVDPQAIIERGKGDEPLIGLTFRCGVCGGEGQPKLTWVNEPRIRERKHQSMPMPGKPRPGYIELATGQKHGGFD